MGAIGGLIGLDGGANGTGFSGPQGAQLTNPVSGSQLNTAYGGAQGSLSAQQQLLQALQNQNGLQNQSQVYNQLQGIVNGTGPNPAQAMLNNSTGQNVSNQAALMAGQRGAGANTGLIARQAGQQGAAIQQNAVGQGAALQAQQSLNALTGAGNIANSQVGNQIGATTANTNANLGEQQLLLGANQGFNNAQVGMQSNINNANAGLANKTMEGQQGLLGGGANGAGGLAGIAFAQGGQASASTMAPQSGPQSSLGKYLSQNPMAKGGVAKDYRVGGGVKASNPQQKAKVPGNSYSNDKIPAVLSEGEIVIPRSVMQSGDPIRNAAMFVQSVMAKRKVKG